MGFVKVGPQTLASQAAARAGAGVYHNTGQWIPPQVSATVGSYNPLLDIELNAGKRGLSNTLEDLGTKNVRGEQGYLLGKGEVERQQAQQGQEHAKALAALLQNYERLGSRQKEQANTAGVLRGGALAQAAAKRAANEGKAKEPIEEGYARSQESDQRALAKLALGRQQEVEDIGTQGSRAEREQNQYGIDTRTVEGTEAANYGYLDPGGVVAHTSQQQGGFVRVGQPLKVNPYANYGRR